MYLHIIRATFYDYQEHHLFSVTSDSQNNPEEFQNIHSSIEEFKKSVHNLQDGFSKQKVNISKLATQVRVKTIHRHDIC